MATTEYKVELTDRSSTDRVDAVLTSFANTIGGAEIAGATDALRTYAQAYGLGKDDGSAAPGVTKKLPQNLVMQLHDEATVTDVARREIQMMD